jgi:regulator of sigma E protease
MMDSIAAFFLNFYELVRGTLLPYIVVLTVLVFVHEFGHFIVGRWCGVKVNVFAIGFGPELFGFTDKKNTRWKFCAIPLGGYVKFAGDANGASMPDAQTLSTMDVKERNESLFFKPVWQRALIVAAGPIANFILAIALFAGLFYAIGVNVIQPVLGTILEGSPAEISGLKSGDRIVSIDGFLIENFDDVVSIVSINGGNPLKFKVNRAGQQVDIVVTPKLVENTTNLGKDRRGQIGAKSPQDRQYYSVKTLSPLEAVNFGVQKSWFIIDRTVRYFGGLIAGREHADQISGPVGIAQVTGQMFKDGIPSLIFLAAVISVSLGFFNLLPVPVLDGGHLLFFLIEAVRRKPLSLRVQEFGFRIGLSLLAMLIIFATYNDIVERIPWRKIMGI